MLTRAAADAVPSLEFLRLLWDVNHAMHRRSKSMQATIGISAPQRMVLRFVGRTPGIFAGDLAQTLHIDRGTLSSSLRALEAKKLISRKGDGRDGRRVRISLTERGRRFDTDMPRTIEAAIRATLAQLPKREALAARRMLETLARELNGSDPPSPPD